MEEICALLQELSKPQKRKPRCGSKNNPHMEALFVKKPKYLCIKCGWYGDYPPKD